MKTKKFYFISFVILIVSLSCNPRAGKKLQFSNYPNLKIGFSTQNFLAAMPNNVENLTEIIEYAAKEGYQFIMLRDELAELTTKECMKLAEVAGKNAISVIYEIHKNPLDTGYFEVFGRGLANTTIFPDPGILRTVVSKSEFEEDGAKKGWNKEELELLARITDSCAVIAKSVNVSFIVENFNEAFFGDGATYYGIADLFNHTSITGFQFDMSNMFRKSTRVMTEPDSVVQYLHELGNRWITTHLKTVITMGGDMQEKLTDNPLPVEKVIELMGEQNVLYVAFELAPVSEKQQCFDNHAASVQFLKDKGILE